MIVLFTGSKMSFKGRLIGDTAVHSVYLPILKAIRELSSSIPTRSPTFQLVVFFFFTTACYKTFLKTVRRETAAHARI